VDEIVQMRPQFHHIDAAAEVERLSRPRDLAAPRAGEPRAIHMTVKSTADGEEETTDTMAERIRSAQEEPWRRLTYVDEDSGEAWDAFNDYLFVDDSEEAAKLVSGMDNAQYLDAISAPRDAARLSRSRTSRKKKGKGGKEGESEGVDDSESSSTLTDVEESGESEDEV
jgi:DNA-directed RNA polymerase-3 subunit RPC5